MRTQDRRSLRMPQPACWYSRASVTRSCNLRGTQYRPVQYQGSFGYSTVQSTALYRMGYRSGYLDTCDSDVMCAPLTSMTASTGAGLPRMATRVPKASRAIPEASKVSMCPMDADHHNGNLNSSHHCIDIFPPNQVLLPHHPPSLWHSLPPHLPSPITRRALTSLPSRHTRPHEAPRSLQHGRYHRLR